MRLFSHHIRRHFVIIYVVIRQVIFFIHRQQTRMNINMQQQVIQHQHHNNINVLPYLFGPIDCFIHRKILTIIMIVRHIHVNQIYSIYNNIYFRINKIKHLLQTRTRIFYVVVVIIIITMKRFFFRQRIVDVVFTDKIQTHISFLMYIDKIILFRKRKLT